MYVTICLSPLLSWKPNCDDTNWFERLFRADAMSRRKGSFLILNNVKHILCGMPTLSLVKNVRKHVLHSQRRP